MKVELMDESVLQQVARIIGPASAASQALKQAADRRLAGEKVVLARAGNRLLVVPLDDLLIPAAADQAKNDAQGH